MLLTADDSCLILVDVQTKLTGLIHQNDLLVENCRWMLRLATALQIPVLVSEQYPKGLGPTLPELLELCPDAPMMQKVHFSCGADDTCVELIKDQNRRQIVLVGIETHVCVLQTAVDLHQQGYDVFVIHEAVSSRNAIDKELAIARMRDLGIHVLSKEMALFEWAHQAGTQSFKDLSKTFLQ